MKKNNIYLLQLLTIVIFSLVSFPALAASGMPDIGQMFSNFSDTSIKIMTLVSGTAFVVGIALSLKAAFALKEYSESGGRTQLKTPIVTLLAGVMLVSFPETISMATETISLGANTGAMLSDVGGGGSEAVAMMSSALSGVLLFVKMVGHIAVFRGILILKRVYEGNQQASIGSALTHIFGGAACININRTIDMLANTVGMTLPI